MGAHGIRWIAALAVLGAVLSANTATGHLVAYWSFDEAQGEDVPDLVGNNRGTLQGTVTYMPGNKGNALGFDGRTGYVLVKQAIAFDIVNAITIAAWIKVDALDRPYQTIVAKGDSAWRISRDMLRSALQFAANNGERRWVVRGNADVDDGKWHHVVAVFDGTMARLYMDGRLDSSLLTSTPIQMNDFDVCIGENAERPNRYWNGLIDEVMIFNHALSETEIQQIHRVGAQTLMPETLRALRETVEQAQAKLRQKDAQEAIKLIERGVIRYQQVRRRNVAAVASESDRLLLADLYFLLADAKDLAGAPKKEVASLYSTSALFIWGSQDFVPALLWLYRNVSADAYRQVIERSMPDRGQATRWLASVAREFHSRCDWAAFELFARTLFKKSGYGVFEANTILNALGRDSRWGRSFLEFASRETALWPFFVDASTAWAWGYVQQGRFLHAADAYRDIARGCPTAQDAAVYEFKACECVYRSAHYEDAIRGLDQFAAENGRIDAALTRKALLLKGRAQMHLQQMDQACATFEALARAGSKQEAAEAHFYLAGCKIAQGDTEGAETLLVALISEAPETSSAHKARLLLPGIRKKAS